ncbi:MAG TPA: hypothetical protein VF927_03325 [Solirubrobacteraceae bacterium]
MSYSSAEGRTQLLDVVGQAADHLATALGLLSGAYELLDERSAEQLEERIFRPVQVAYGRIRRTHSEFAARYDLPGREFAQGAEGAPARGLQGLVERAVGEVLAADGELATLQDSMLPVEVGDAELRAGLQDVRSRLTEVPGAARQLMRTFGR